MLRIIENHKAWARKYGLDTSNIDCICGKSLELNQAIAFKGYRGLKASECSNCGTKNLPSRFTPIDCDSIRAWDLLRPVNV